MAELIDNRNKRIAQLKEIILGLHAGDDIDDVRRRLRDLVGSTDVSEIAAMEQQLMADGMPPEEIVALCDLHVEVTREIMQERHDGMIEPGHPVDTFRRENEAVLDRLAQVRELLAATSDSGNTAHAADTASRLEPLLLEMASADKHYARKENLVFPVLERYGISAPSQVMWARDNEARALATAALAAVQSPSSPTLDIETIETAVTAIANLVANEDDILWPLTLHTFTEADWSEVFEQTPQFGYTLITPGVGYVPIHEQPVTIGHDDREDGEQSDEPSVDAALSAGSGTLTADQLLGIFNTMPVDLTFIDHDDRVRYFTEGSERVFPRPRTILGRKVSDCHPPSSVHVVEKILTDFRSGEQNTCGFWLEANERFVYIRYFAIRDPEQKYLGTLEVTQDLTNERNLEGERRLLEYDA